MCPYSFKCALTSGALLFTHLKSLPNLDYISTPQCLRFFRQFAFTCKFAFNVIFQFTLVYWLFYVLIKKFVFCLHLEWPGVYSQHPHLECMDPMISNALIHLKFRAWGKRWILKTIGVVQQILMLQILFSGGNVSTNLADIANICFIVARFAQIRLDFATHKHNSASLKKKTTKPVTFSQIFSFYSIPFGFTTSS